MSRLRIHPAPVPTYLSPTPPGQYKRRRPAQSTRPLTKSLCKARERGARKWPDTRLDAITDRDLLGDYRVSTLARLFGVGQMTVSQWLSGKNRVPFTVGMKLSRALRLSPEFLERLLDYRRASFQTKGAGSSPTSPSFP